MGGCATKENKENKPADEADGCVSRAGSSPVSNLSQCYSILFRLIISLY